jgi:hypothetical protein
MGHSISAMPAPPTLASLNVDCEVLTVGLSSLPEQAVESGSRRLGYSPSKVQMY